MQRRGKKGGRKGRRDGGEEALRARIYCLVPSIKHMFPLVIKRGRKGGREGGKIWREGELQRRCAGKGGRREERMTGGEGSNAWLEGNGGKTVRKRGKKERKKSR